jgi:hypothetical protein
MLFPIVSRTQRDELYKICQEFSGMRENVFYRPLNIGFHATCFLGRRFSLATAETAEVGGESDLPTYITHGLFTLLKVN